LETNLSPVNLAAWIASQARHPVDVTLPKFKVAAGLELNKILGAMGMKAPFDKAEADFSGMDGRTHWLYLSAVLHKAYIDVNEKGTEAAVVTAGTITPLAMSAAEESKEFRADHPFLFLLRDSSTGSILFIGRVFEPKTE
jgi:serpin B